MSNQNKDDLINEAGKTQNSLRRQKPTIAEANIAYLAIMLFCSITIILLPLLNKLVGEYVFIALSVISLVLSIMMFILAFKLSKIKNTFKLFYYLDFMFIALGIMFSLLAVTTYYDIDLKLGGAACAAGALLAISAIDILILFVGKKERLWFSLSSLIFLATAIVGGIIFYKYDNALFGLPLFSYSLIMLFLHLTMLLYVCNGDGFFEMMSFSYLFIALIALTIALLALGGGDCDCGGCDCGGGGGGGRRAKNKTNRSLIQ